PLSRRHHASLQALGEGYRRLGRDLGHGLRALEDLQAHGLTEAFERRLLAGAHDLEVAERSSSRAGARATWLPLMAGATVVVLILGRGLVDQPLLGLRKLATLV